MDSVGDFFPQMLPDCSVFPAFPLLAACGSPERLSTLLKILKTTENLFLCTSVKSPSSQSPALPDLMEVYKMEVYR